MNPASCSGAGRSAAASSVILVVWAWIAVCVPQACVPQAQAETSNAAGRAKPTASQSGSLSTPSPQATQKPLSAEEQEKKEWIRRWCRRAKKDPKCKFYVEKQLGEAMREVSKQDHLLGLDEYCNVHKDDLECMARKEKSEAHEKARRMKELITFCRENPDAPRCEDAFSDEPEETSKSSTNSAKKVAR